MAFAKGLTGSTERTGRVRLRCAALSLAIGLAFLPLSVSAQDDAGKKTVVLVATIEGTIDLGLVPFVERVLQEAEAAQVGAVIFEINTFGGRVDAAVAIRDQLLRSPKLVVAFVNKRAISAGALISLAAQRIVIARGGTMGAATPVQMGAPGESPKPTDEKTVSYMRKEFRATADARKRPGTIAEAMVDPDVAVPGLIAKGKLLTLTTEDAIKHKVADHVAEDIPGVLSSVGLAGAEIRRVGPNWAERTVRFLTHPIQSSILISLAILGIMVEIRTPGIGVAGFIGLASLAAFFWGHALVHLVGWEELLLVGAGLVLLAIELFVTPGFGFLGVSGGVALLTGLTMSLIGKGASINAAAGAVSRVLLALLAAAAASLLVLRFLPRLPIGRNLVLKAALGRSASPEAPAMASRGLVGETGIASTPLRPTGIAVLSGRRVDVVSQGDYIEAGEPVEVVIEAGSRVVVRRFNNKTGGTT